MALGLLGAFGSIAGSVIGKGMQQDAQREQFENEKEMMGLQYRYNEAMAQSNQERAKEMWDYTNYENQVQHMKNAGLSVGLMYGQGGGSGTSTSGGQGSGVGNSGTSAVTAGLQARAMGLQIAQLASQIDLNKSQAKKNEAEANKTAGVDTDLTKTTIDNVIADTNNKSAQKQLIIAQAKLNEANQELAEANTNLADVSADQIRWNVTNLQKGLQLLDEQLTGLKLDNTKKAAVMNTEIEQSKVLLKQMMANVLKTQAETRLTDAEVENIFNEIWTRGETVAQGWKGLVRDFNKQRIEANKILFEMGVAKKQLSQRDTEILSNVVIGILNVASHLPTMPGK